MTEREMEYAKKYKRDSEVTMEECYIGGKYCSSCMHCTGNSSYDSSLFGHFEHDYCMMAKRES